MCQPIRHWVGLYAVSERCRGTGDSCNSLTLHFISCLTQGVRITPCLTLANSINEDKCNYLCFLLTQRYRSRGQ